jgi:serine/threonine-protein kinase
MGTPLYVSPEQARDATSVDARSDVYSVSAMLYELLSGRPPFDSPTLAGLFMQLAMVTPTSLDELRADLPPGLAEVVQRGLAKLPEQRFQSAVEMAWALAPYSDGRSEVVLRQLVQRPSMHAGRSSSQAPPLSSLSSGPPARSAAYLTPKPPGISSHPPAAIETRGTAPGVVRAGAPAAGARSIASKTTAHGRRAWIAVPLVLFAAAGALVAVGVSAGWGPFEKTNAAAQPEAVPPPTEPAKSALPPTEPRATARAPATPQESSPPEPSAPVASAKKPSNRTSPAAESPASGSSAVGASSSLHPPEPPPAKPLNSKPALSKIGLQD